MAAADAGGPPPVGGGRRRSASSWTSSQAQGRRRSRRTGSRSSSRSRRRSRPGRSSPRRSPRTSRRRRRVTRTCRPTRPARRSERDWLFQADGKPTAERIRQEIAWTRQLAARIEAGVPRRGSLRRAVGRTGRAGEAGGRADGARRRTLLPGARSSSARSCFSNPVVDFDKILLVDMPYPAGHRSGRTRRGTGWATWPCRAARLLVLDGLSPGGQAHAAHAAGAAARLVLAARCVLRRPEGRSSASSRTTRSRSTSTRSTSTARAWCS